MKAANRVVIGLALALAASVSFAYEQKSCMKGIFEASQRLSSSLEESNRELSATMGALLSANVQEDYATVIDLTSKVSSVSLLLDTTSALSILRESGAFKDVRAVDKVVANRFQVLHIETKFVRDSFTKYVGSLRNVSLRNQAFVVSQQLDKVLEQLKGCQK